MSTSQLIAQRRSIEIPSGRVSFLEQGEGPAALFIHGVFLNAHMWDGVIDGVADTRRCIAPDLLAYGATREHPDADVSFAGQAQALVDFIDRLDIDRVDLVANDSGGGIAQILAARHPQRIRTLTLTNCDVHDGWPPPAFEPTVQAALAGGLPGLLQSMYADANMARAALAPGFEFPERLSDDTLRGFIAPFLEPDDRVAGLERFFRAMDCRRTIEIEPLLRRLTAPTLILWGTADIFFDIKWASWLRETIPGARPVVELPGAKLFFPFERPARLSSELRRHWDASAGAPAHVAA